MCSMASQHDCVMAQLLSHGAYQSLLEFIQALRPLPQFDAGVKLAQPLLQPGKPIGAPGVGTSKRVP